MEKQGQVKTKFIIKLIGASMGTVGFFVMAFGSSRIGTIVVGIGTILIALGE